MAFTSNTLVINKHRSVVTDFLRDEDQNALIVVGETGSGKTTQIPQWCKGWLKVRNMRNLAVACTQPRRIAAISVATRVAKEMDTELGQEIGYSVRFEKCMSAQTRLRYLTDGMLLREAMLDGLLKSYGVIIMDEAHERTLQTEILMGVVKRAFKLRNEPNSGLPPLKVIVMSATINVNLFRDYWNASVLSVEGRQHPVQDMFVEFPQSDLLTSTITTVFQIHRTREAGDILVFCAGQDEINSLITICKKCLKVAKADMQNLLPLPLYASLPANHQMIIFNHDTTRKVNGYSHSNQNGNGATSHDQHNDDEVVRRVIFSTNVAETSVTIPNIRYVIDTGRVKCRSYCPKTGLDSLKITTTSKAQAIQRSGRAGRVAPGTCYRLYTSDDYEQMVDYLTPEIKRCNLDSVLLQMISTGINDLNSFEFLEKPEESRLRAALNDLLDLKAIKISTANGDRKETGNQATPHNFDRDKTNIMNFKYELTNLGKKLCIFPLNPSMGRVILAANELGCLDEALTIVSLLFIENLFHIPPSRQAQADTMLEKFRSNEGDTIMYLKVFKAYKRTATLNRAGLKKWCAEHFIHTKNLKLARQIRVQLLQLTKSLGMESSSCGQDTSMVRKALTYGLFNKVATMWNGKYRNKYCDDIHIHPNSCLFKSKPDSVLYTEIVETNKCYMRNCTLIDLTWVRETFSSAVSTSASSSS